MQESDASKMSLDRFGNQDYWYNKMEWPLIINEWESCCRLHLKDKPNFRYPSYSSECEEESLQNCVEILA